MKELNCEAALETEIREHAIVILLFGSETCGPCQALREKISHWAKARPDVGAVYIPVSRFPVLAAQSGIFTVPAVAAYVEGRPALREAGCFSLEDFLKKLEKHRKMLMIL